MRSEDDGFSLLRPGQVKSKYVMNEEMRLKKRKLAKDVKQA